MRFTNSPYEDFMKEKSYFRADLFQAQFPGQIDPLHPGLTPERHSGAVYGMGLCGQMQRH